jgi:hypothetical protein
MMSEPTPSDLKLRRDRLFCPFGRDVKELFFSLVDYRNSYFTSEDPNKILEFYNGFESRDQLIQWMRERPKGVANIHEVEGDKDIIVVIPTADFNGKYARECRENVFKGLHIIFVESGGKGDFYFNFARNCNIGLKRAMEYNPNWIVVSNDDMNKVDEPARLVENLRKLEFEKPECDLVFATPVFPYVSESAMIVKPRISRKIINTIIDHRASGTGFSILQHFNVEYMLKYNFSFFSNLFYKPLFKYTCFVSFGIFRPKFLLKNKSKFGYFFPLGDDDQISIFAAASKSKICYSNYKIKPEIGKSMGRGINRYLRNIVLARILISDYLEEVVDKNRANI